MALLDAKSAGRMGKNSLFVVGRNIYQAACGNANDAAAFVRDFMTATAGFAPEKRKAVLDGMLFEVFFDADGMLRTSIKGRFFDELFELQRHKDLKGSFDFIAESLTAARADFFAVPGKGHELAVSISTVKKKGGLLVDAIYVGGVNVLRDAEDKWLDADGNPIYSRISPTALEAELSEQMVVPARLLKVTYATKEASKADELRIPRGWTVRKE
jgi:hypothetical protein